MEVVLTRDKTHTVQACAGVDSSSIPAEHALIRVAYAGICSTDLALTAGYYDFHGVAGHEFAGVVQAVSDQASIEHQGLIGRRVVGEINITCGQCSQCRALNSHHCLDRSCIGIKSAAGCWASTIVLPARNLHVIPDSVPLRRAVFTEPLAAALSIPRDLHVSPLDCIAVVGAGKLGLLIAQVLRLSGAAVCVLVRTMTPKRMALLHQLDLNHAVIDDPGSPAAASFDLVVECSGNVHGWNTARRMVRPKGTIVVKSTYPDNMTLNMASLVVDEIRLVGSRCGPFSPALRLLQAGLVRTDLLIDREYDLSDALDAIDAAKKPGACKILLRCGPDPDLS